VHVMAAARPEASDLKGWTSNVSILSAWWKNVFLCPVSSRSASWPIKCQVSARNHESSQRRIKACEQLKSFPAIVVKKRAPSVSEQVNKATYNEGQINRKKTYFSSSKSRDWVWL
jgi:hypothetical protein